MAQTAGVTGEPGYALVEGRRPGMEPAVSQQRDEVDPPAPPLGHGHVVAQLHRSVRFDDHLCGPVDLAQPCAEPGRVGDGGRQAHEDDIVGSQDDRFLPHRPPIGILEVMHLVEHEQAEPGQVR